MGFAVGGREISIGAKMGTSVLEGVAGFAQVLDAIVEGDDPGDLLTHHPAGFAAEQMGFLGMDGGGEVEQNFPFRPRLAHLAGDFRTEHDPAFGAGLGATIVLLVAGFGREQKDLLVSLDEHLVGENDILMNANRDFGQGVSDVVGIGEGCGENSRRGNKGDQDRRGRMLQPCLWR